MTKLNHDELERAVKNTVLLRTKRVEYMALVRLEAERTTTLNTNCLFKISRKMKKYYLFCKTILLFVL